MASGSLPGGLPADFYTTVTRLIEAAGSRLVLDTAGPTEGVFLLRCNRTEAGDLLGSVTPEPGRRHRGVHHRSREPKQAARTSGVPHSMMTSSLRSG